MIKRLTIEEPTLYGNSHPTMLYIDYDYLCMNESDDIATIMIGTEGSGEYSSINVTKADARLILAKFQEMLLTQERPEAKISESAS